MTDGRYVLLLSVFVLSVVIVPVAIIAGPNWSLAISAALAGTGAGGSARAERQRRMTERTRRLTPTGSQHGR
jgi:hypothetical protein